MDNKCLQHIKNFKFLSCEISYEYEKDILKKILGISNNTLNQLWSRNVQEKKYIMHCLSTFFYMELKFGPLEKRVKMTNIHQD